MLSLISHTIFEDPCLSDHCFILQAIDVTCFICMLGVFYESFGQKGALLQASWLGKRELIHFKALKGNIGRLAKDKRYCHLIYHQYPKYAMA
jgi:hypothetical protein